MRWTATPGRTLHHRERRKDLTYYNRLANRHGAATLMSDGALQTLKLGVAMGMGERYMPQIGDIVLALNGAEVAE